MKCPKCSYEPSMAEHAASQDRCPNCGFSYAKVTLLQRKALEDAERERLSAQRAERAGSQRQLVPASPVTVVDLQMPFGSMVVFMVKWALASIPAVIILAIASVVVFSLLGSLLSSR